MPINESFKGRVTVDVEVPVDVFGAADLLEETERRLLTLHQLAELVRNEHLSPEELAAIQTAVLIVNRHTEFRFFAGNVGLPKKEAKLLGLS